MMIIGIYEPALCSYCLYQSGVEFSDKSNEIVFNTVSPVSFMQIRLKTHFYNWIFLPLSGNLLGQNRAPYQILAF